MISADGYSLGVLEIYLRGYLSQIGSARVRDKGETDIERENSRKASRK